MYTQSMDKGVQIRSLPRAVLHSAAHVVPPPADLAQVYSDHFRFVWRCLKRLGVPEEQLDDAVQEVFLVVHRKLADFDGQSALSTWLYAIALRISRRVHRARSKERHRSAEGGTASIESTLGGPGPSPEQSAQLAQAQKILMQMEEAKREIFVLGVIEGLSAPEIAPILGIPLNTVYSRLRAARLCFAELVGRDDTSPGSSPSAAPRSR